MAFGWRQHAPGHRQATDSTLQALAATRPDGVLHVGLRGVVPFLWRLMTWVRSATECGDSEEVVRPVVNGSSNTWEEDA